jgi:HSP20 family protein
MNKRPRKLPVFFSSQTPSDRHLWQPAADIYRTRGGWLVKLDVAGVRLDDIATEITANGVGIQGCRRDFHAVEGCRHYHMEISYNRFQRFIPLPCDLTGAEVHVEYADGVLLIRLMTEGNLSERE